MNETFSLAAITGMLISTFFSVAVPVTALLFLRSKYRSGWKAALVGALAFLVFSYYTAGLLNNVILSSASDAFGADTAAFAVFLVAYSCLMAGLIDATACLLCLRHVVKEPVLTDALMYGAGLGGVGAIAFTGMSSFGLWGLASSVNAYGVAETAEMVTSDAPETAGEMILTIDSLLGVNSVEFFAPSLGVIISVAAYAALSVLILMSARGGSLRYYLMTIGLRALFALPDALSGAGAPIGPWAAVLLSALPAACAALLARDLYKKSGLSGLSGKPAFEYSPRLR